MKEEETEERLTLLLLLKRRSDDVPDHLNVFITFLFTQMLFLKAGKQILCCGT